MKLDKLKIARLDLKPGDTLVAQPDHALTHAASATLRVYLETSTPVGVHVLILEPGIALSVIPAHG